MKSEIGMTIVFGAIAMSLWNIMPRLMNDAWHAAGSDFDYPPSLCQSPRCIERGPQTLTNRDAARWFP